jgi:hypothetical protein
MDGGCVDGAYTGGAYTDVAYIGGACADGAYTGGAVIVARVGRLGRGSSFKVYGSIVLSS